MPGLIISGLMVSPCSAIMSGRYVANVQTREENAKDMVGVFLVTISELSLPKTDLESTRPQLQQILMLPSKSMLIKGHG